MAETSGKAGLILSILDRLLKLPFHQFLSLVLAAAMISLVAYDIGWGRPALVKQVDAGHKEARDQFDKQLGGVVDQMSKQHERQLESIKTLVRDLVIEARRVPQVGRSRAPFDDDACVLE
jgi:hypothetical protein